MEFYRITGSAVITAVVSLTCGSVSIAFICHSGGSFTFPKLVMVFHLAPTAHALIRQQQSAGWNKDVG